MEPTQNGAITFNFSDGHVQHMSREWWIKNKMDRFDAVRAEKINGYGIVFYGSYLSEAEKLNLPKKEVLEVKTEFNVVLTSFGEKKLDVVKAVKALTNLGLKESMAIVNDAPSVLKESVSADEANAIKEQLEKSGATVELK